MEEVITEKKDNRILRGMINSIVRGLYDIQHLRIQTGNRITGNFKAKLGYEHTGEKTDAQLGKEEKKILNQLIISHRRITDGIVEDTLEEINDLNFDKEQSKLPTRRKFKADGLIDTYTELSLVDQYVRLLNSEQSQFKYLEKSLEDIPIYMEFLKDIDGIGPAMAGVIVSEIDIHKANYPSSLIAYAGIDSITIGKYTDSDGKEHIITANKISKMLEENEGKVDGWYIPLKTPEGYEIFLHTEGRSKKEQSLVEREYKDKEGNIKVRKSITHNPWLKSKLIAVLGPSFLLGGKVLVNGINMGVAKREEKSEELGFVFDKESDVPKKDQVISFLRTKGFIVEDRPSKYGKVYYDYKNRLDNHPYHKDKTGLHKHNMAIRKMITVFLHDLYSVWREIEGLVVALPYHEAKLGLAHRRSVPAKATFVSGQNIGRRPLIMDAEYNQSSWATLSKYQIGEIKFQ